MSELNYNDDLVQCTGNDYDSSFESDRDGRRKQERRLEKLIQSAETATSSKNESRLKDTKKHFREEHSREERRRERQNVLSLDAYSRHKKLINDYFLCYKGQAKKLARDASRDKTDADCLRENHRFVWDDVDTTNLSWGERLAKKYYDKLFKEYCITDLRYYEQNKIAFRWRTEQEVIIGKGQFSCGEKKCSTLRTSDLRSWEVNFAYVEQGERKNTLVKVRLCPDCSAKLNFKKQRKEIKRKRKSKPKSESRSKRSKKTKENVTESSESSSDDGTDEVVKVLEEKPTETEDNPWAKPLQVEEEVKIEDEFEAFFDEMFL